MWSAAVSPPRFTWLPAYRLLPPRSGLERSDFVHWPEAAVRCGKNFGRYRAGADIRQTLDLDASVVNDRGCVKTRRWI
jgi:hypothetical protein